MQRKATPDLCLWSFQNNPRRRTGKVSTRVPQVAVAQSNTRRKKTTENQKTTTTGFSRFGFSFSCYSFARFFWKSFYTFSLSLFRLSWNHEIWIRERLLAVYMWELRAENNGVGKKKYVWRKRNFLKTIILYVLCFKLQQQERRPGKEEAKAKRP